MGKWRDWKKSVSVSERRTKQAESDTRRNEALFKLGSGAERQRIASVVSWVSLTGLQRM